MKKNSEIDNLFYVSKSKCLKKRWLFAFIIFENRFPSMLCTVFDALYFQVFHNFINNFVDFLNFFF